MRLWTTIACLLGITAPLCSEASEHSNGPFPPPIAPRRIARRVPLVNGNDIQFRRLRTPLPQTHVGQIVQDHKRLIGSGKQDGLNRYDGYELKGFRHDPDSDDSLSGVFVFSLLEDRTGRLWVGSDEFLDRFDAISETFTRYEF